MKRVSSKSIKIKELIKTDKDEVKSVLEQLELKRMEKIYSSNDEKKENVAF